MPKKVTSTRHDVELDEIANEVGERIAHLSKDEEEYGRNLKRIVEILKENL